MITRMLVVQSQEIVRAGLKTAMENSDIQIVGETQTVEETLRYAFDQKPDIVLLDTTLAHADGLLILEKLRLQYSDLPVVMYSSYDNSTYISRAVSLGASGYVLKSCTSEDLVSAIQTAKTGRPIWTQQQLRRAAAASSKPLARLDVEAPLTDRELQVLAHLAKGLTNNQIAEALGISYETVKEHVQHILRKISVTCRTQAAVWAVRNHLA